MLCGKCLIDADLRRKFSNAGRLRVEQNFTWKIVAEKIFALYCQVLGRECLGFCVKRSFYEKVFYSG